MIRMRETTYTASQPKEGTKHSKALVMPPEGREKKRRRGQRRTDTRKESYGQHNQ